MMLRGGGKVRVVEIPAAEDHVPILGQSRQGQISQRQSFGVIGTASDGFNPGYRRCSNCTAQSYDCHTKAATSRRNRHLNFLAFHSLKNGALWISANHVAVQRIFGDSFRLYLVMKEVVFCLRGIRPSYNPVGVGLRISCRRPLQRAGDDRFRRRAFGLDHGLRYASRSATQSGSLSGFAKAWSLEVDSPESVTHAIKQQPGP
ncbi:hypothetical protein [Roseicella sp. DB1501]|uniref:hypothetical protein n=1 Tax=Roseicella sp. DB1501 TaxID=2730925 RepID=UPI001C2BA4C1|nr:hypothetical protein [Roseicella sp. DB1501]